MNRCHELPQLFSSIPARPIPPVEAQGGRRGRKKAIEERERFATAAIAFCLKHDKEFRSHFWQKICRVNGDPTETPDFGEFDIQLEPPRWADLRFTTILDGIRYSWVIELKAGADLEDIQNPTMPAFLSPKGYGSLMLGDNEGQNTKRRYIILGHRPPLKIADGRQYGGIACQQRTWDDFLEIPRTPLVNDLISSLAELNLEEFVVEKAKGITVSSGLSNIGSAWKVLEGICSWLTVPESKRQFEAYTPDEGGDVLGVYIKAPRGSVNSLQYRNLTGNAGGADSVCWFGYFIIPGKPIRRSVYIYCCSERVRKRTRSRSWRSEDELIDEVDGETLCLVINGGGSGETDVDFFQRVIKTAAVD